MKLVVFACITILASMELYSQNKEIELEPRNGDYSSGLSVNDRNSINKFLKVKGEMISVDSSNYYKHQNMWLIKQFNSNKSLYKIVREGKISIYREIENPSSGNSIQEVSQGEEAISYQGKFYYVNQLGDLKRLQYKNLVHELSGHEESMEFLREAKKIKKTNTIYYSVLSSMIVTGLIQTFRKIDRQSDNEAFKGPTVSPWLIGGGLLITIRLYKRGEKNRKMLQAIEAYN